MDERNDIYFRIVDDKGKAIQLEVDSADIDFLGEWIYLVCEFGMSEESFTMSISINGNEVDRRNKIANINLSVMLEKQKFGCDQNEQNFGMFDVGHYLLYSRTLFFREKYKLHNYFEQQLPIKKYGEYDGSKFMNRNNDGDFIQENEERKPIIRITQNQ